MTMQEETSAEERECIQGVIDVVGTNVGDGLNDHTAAAATAGTFVMHVGVVEGAGGARWAALLSWATSLLFL